MLCVSNKIVFTHPFQYLCYLVANGCCKVFRPLFIPCALHSAALKTRKTLGLLVKAILADNSQYLLNFPSS